ncbi:DUF1569 domain-containing protein [Dinghuibacter silviterrae]|uniref:Uncharacterized protein DUF1569 n=1 Tax=Dinghuibacter silviterrae TaxID=1539049 RepID=A0A4V3GM55_9BACT|nr:DUF1569 domain-containing protein [Dinghuibacter silviterrae]TDX02103.1 uncharacterized protein DUF1569 [Dinghuibacter silviterrae]
MKTIYDPQTCAGVIARIEALEPGTTPLWGKMTAYQMVKHCRLWEEMSLGRTTYPRAFIGRIVGRLALARVLSDDRPLDRNTPTLPALIIREEGDIAQEKAAWIACLRSYGDKPGPGIVHPFFGRLTGEQVGAMAYKHADHHLRQFNY